ncbi:MerR family transcriptional regulator [Paracoccus homiensis]|uniref:HTH merR-type domain-containing protein n=1 Tax=Paracoccus homiensis TaxID=364199 RepID=A0A1I0J3M7_9RHOB|nr:hypothetical protein [Paracoccus homiensis]SEU04133.1 hypothetical protein SAMN04489858_1213 [Paracoccus homiensis]
MTRFYSETEVVARIDELTPGRLHGFLRSRVVVPVEAGDGARYRDADLARLQLLCHLIDCYDLRDDALSLVMSLVDQLNTARGDMRAVMQVLAEQPDELRQRLHADIRARRG